MVRLLAHRHPPPLPSAICSLSQSFCVSLVELTDGGEGGEGWAWSRIIRPQESLALYNSFNTLCIYIMVNNKAYTEGKKNLLPGLTKCQHIYCIYK
jgi:hypothetical protein